MSLTEPARSSQLPRSSQLLCVGDINLDVTVTLKHELAIGSDTSGTVELHSGGSSANVAAWAAEAGCATRFVGAIGDDHIAPFLLGELSGHGVEVTTISHPNEPSRAVAAIVGTDGNRSLVSDQTSDLGLTLADFEPGWFDGIGWLHLTGYTYISTTSRELFALLTDEANSRAIPYSVDPSAAQLLRTECDHGRILDAFAGAALLFPSHDEAEYLTGEPDPRLAAEALLDISECVAVTCGADGSYIARRGHSSIAVEAEPTTVVNTLGCGDAFAAGMVAALLAGSNTETAALTGAHSAAKATRLASAR